MNKDTLQKIEERLMFAVDAFKNCKSVDAYFLPTISLHYFYSIITPYEIAFIYC